MINLDSEEEGVFTAACAGGITGRTTIPIRREEISGIAIKLDIKGLKGGHSGTDIDKNRVNALKVVARILAYLPCDQFLLKSISGGHKDNVIPNEAHVEFVVQPGDCKAFKNLLKQTCDMEIGRAHV